MWKLKKLEKQRLLAEAYWDRAKAELICLDFYPIHDAERGDVLFDQRGYVHPALEFNVTYSSTQSQRKAGSESSKI